MNIWGLSHLLGQSPTRHVYVIRDHCFGDIGCICLTEAKAQDMLPKIEKRYGKYTRTYNWCIEPWELVE